MEAAVTCRAEEAVGLVRLSWEKCWEMQDEAEEVGPVAGEVGPAAVAVLVVLAVEVAAEAVPAADGKIEML